MTKPLSWNFPIAASAFTLQFVTSIPVTMLFPFLPWMVRKFEIDGEFVTMEDTGYYAGLVASMFFLGGVMGSYFWGLLADKKGRRPTLLFSSVTIAIGTFLFGLTNTRLGLGWALATRLLTGLSYCIISTLKVVIADVCDDANQPKGLALINSAWMLGLIVGPAIGGSLAEPARQYPNVFKDGFFEMFPYALPSFLSATIILIATVMVYFLLPETKSASFNLTTGNVQSDDYNTSVRQEDGVRLLGVRYRVAGDEVNIIEEVDVDSDIKLLPEVSTVREKSDNRRRPAFLDLFRLPDVRKGIGVYMVFPLAAVGFEELLSVWLATKPYLGGAGFTERDIGLFAAFSSILLVPILLFVPSKLEKKMGSLNLFYVGSCFIIFGFLAVPSIAYLQNRVLFWAVAALLICTIRFSQACCFISVSIIINNSAPPTRIGAVNGLALASTSIARTFAPSLGGSLFAWSIDYGATNLGFPLNHFFAFCIFSVAVYFSLLIAITLPERVNYRQPVEKSEGQIQ